MYEVGIKMALQVLKTIHTRKRLKMKVTGGHHKDLKVMNRSGIVRAAVGFIEASPQWGCWLITDMHSSQESI